MSSAAVVIGALRVNTESLVWRNQIFYLVWRNWYFALKHNLWILIEANPESISAISVTCFGAKPV